MFAYIYFLTYTGVRRGEGMALTWENVNLDRGTAFVAATVVKPKNGLMSKRPKTRRAVRTIDLDPGTVEVLKEHRARQIESGISDGHSGLVFPGVSGEMDEAHHHGPGPEAVGISRGRWEVDLPRLPTLPRHDVAIGRTKRGCRFTAIGPRGPQYYVEDLRTRPDRLAEGSGPSLRRGHGGGGIIPAIDPAQRRSAWISLGSTQSH